VSKVGKTISNQVSSWRSTYPCLFSVLGRDATACLALPFEQNFRSSFFVRLLLRYQRGFLSDSCNHLSAAVGINPINK